jgi:hypothetical protein
MDTSFNLTIPRLESSLADALSEVPRAFRIQAQAGFKVLASVSKQHYAEDYARNAVEIRDFR